LHGLALHRQSRASRRSSHVLRRCGGHADAS
jgi:hypothetical protein